MTVRPEVIVFDVNGTLSDLGPMRQRFADVGAPGELAEAWFTAALRDGCALTVTGDSEKFAQVIEGEARAHLARGPLSRPLDEAVRHVLAGFAGLTVHPDGPEGVRLLASQEIRLVTLSNGSPAVAERLLTRAGLADYFEQLLSTEEAGVWKPAAAGYEYAVRACGVDPGRIMMVAAHPFDLHGAHRAGLRTAWIDRDAEPYPGYFSAPELSAPGLAQLARELDFS